MMSEPRDDQAILSSKYSLVIAVAKRARDIVNRKENAASSAHKPVSIALQEIRQGKIQIVMKKEEPAQEEAVTEAEEPKTPEEPEPLQ